MVFGGERGLAPAALMDRLSDDGAVDLDSVFRRVFAYIFGNIDDEISSGFGDLVQLSDNFRDRGGCCFVRACINHRGRR